jgi:hypothetical protein
LSAATWSALCIAFTVIYRDQRLRLDEAGFSAK